MRSRTSDVYRHEMPGGQYTNLREQARSMGLEARWDDVARSYAEANLMFGDIVKVTPSSKVVGNMALFMVASDLSLSDVQDADRDISFPDSVVSMMRGELGYPADGFPPALQQRILKDKSPIEGRAAAHLPEVDLEAERALAADATGFDIDDSDLASWLMYPKLFSDYMANRREFGDVSVIPTPVFFYGLAEQDELAVDIDQGKTLIVRLFGQSDEKDTAQTRLFFELNGQPRPVLITRGGQDAAARQVRAKAPSGSRTQVGAPTPGSISTIDVRVGQRVTKGTPLITIEAMKMESAICAERDGVVSGVLVLVGNRVDAQDLLLEFEE